MKVVDMHNHFIAPEVATFLEREGHRYATRIEQRGGTRFFVIRDSAVRPLHERISQAEPRLRDMDGAGIDVQAVSCVPFLMYPEVDAGLARTIATVNNDGLAALAASHPSRFVALASVPLQDPPAAASELERAAALLVCGGVLERHPKLRVVLYHAGGAFPSLVGRLDKGYELFADLRGSIPRKPSSYVGSFWLDTLAFDETVLRQLIERFTAERFVIGTDYPLPMGPADPVGGVRALGLDADAEAAILGGNARELLRL